MKIYKLCLCAVMALSVAVMAGCGSAASDATSAPETTMTKPTFDATPIKDQYAVMDTNYGTIKIRLYGSKAPITVKNFDALAEKGYYNNLTFHRVIEGFMIQGGDNQKGGPGYTIPDEFVKDLHFNKMGIVAMANRGPNTGDAQFFITVAPTPWLDNKHTIFGVVVQGMDVVEKISQVATDKNDKPKEPVTIQKISIEPIQDEGSK